MRAVINVQMVIEVPNDYSEQKALSLISNEFEEMLNVCFTSNDYVDDLPEVIINSIKIKSFSRLAPLKTNKVNV